MQGYLVVWKAGEGPASAPAGATAQR